MHAWQERQGNDMSKWYYAREGQTIGPVSFEELRRLAETGKIRSVDLVFQEGAAGWTPASAIAGLFAGAPVATVEPLPASPEPALVSVRAAPADEAPEPSSGWWPFVLLQLRRCASWNLRKVPVTPAETRHLAGRGLSEESLQRYLVWRRSTLLVVILLTGIAAFLGAIDQLTSISDLNEALAEVREVAPNFRIAFSGVGMLMVTVIILALFAMPLTAFLAVIHWSQPRYSRSVILWGWGVSFLVPMLLTFVPLRWQVQFEGLPTSVEDKLYGVFGFLTGVGAFFTLMPTVLALVAGTVGACLRLKALFPASTVLGWFLVCAASLHALMLFVVLATLNYIASNPLLILSALVWVLVPLLYVFNASALTRPSESASETNRLDRIRILQTIMGVLALGLFIVYLMTTKILGHSLVAFSDGIMSPWKLLSISIGYFGRMLFIAVFAFDVFLRINLSVWSSTQQATDTLQASEYGQVMQRLRESVDRA
jgi:hypothetical protein